MSSSSESRAELLFHPVRMRILQALLREDRLTAGRIGERLPDVAPATLYRHVNRLLEAGVLEVVEERPVRGVTERVLSLVLPSASIGPEDLADADPEDHLRYFTVFVAGLLEQFEGYLRSGDPDLAADGVGYRQFPLYLSDAEFEEFSAEMNVLLERAMAREPRPGRRRRVLTRIVLPAPDDSGAQG